MVRNVVAVMVFVVLAFGVGVGRQAVGQIDNDLEVLERQMIEARRQGNDAEVAEIRALMAELINDENEEEAPLQERVEQLEWELAKARRTRNDPEVQEILQLLRQLTGGTWRDRTSATRHVDTINVTLDSVSGIKVSSATCGFALVYAPGAQSQVAVMEPAGILVGSVSEGGSITVAIPIVNVQEAFQIAAVAEAWDGRTGQVCLSLDDSSTWHRVGKTHKRLSVAGRPSDGKATLFVKIRAGTDQATIRLSRFQLISAAQSEPLTLPVATFAVREFPRPELPPMHPGIERALIEWDWRMQDGIGTERQARSYDEAIEETLKRGQEQPTRLRSSRCVEARATTSPVVSIVRIRTRSNAGACFR